MGVMSLDVPDGASVLIVVGRAPLLALQDETGWAPERSEPRRKSHPIAKTLVAIALLGGGFVLGQHTRLSPAADAATSATASLNAPAAVTKTFPDHPLASEAPPASPPQVPPAFAEQLRQRPAVVPPPGQPATPGAPGRNAFGLEN